MTEISGGIEYYEDDEKRKPVILTYAGSYAQRWAAENEYDTRILEDIHCTDIKLNSSSIALAKDEMVKISTNISPTDTTDAVMWESSAENVAEVNEVGEVTGKNPGSATIIATTTNGKSARVNVSVNTLNEPAMVSASNVSGGVKVKWKKVSLAKKYCIYRSVNNGSFSKLKTVSGAGTVSYTDKSVKNGKRYSYRVTSLRGDVESGYDYYNKETIYLSPCKLNKVKTTSKKTLTAYYGKNSAGSGYQIQYSTSSAFKNSKKVNAASKNTVKAKITGLKKGKKYYVRVRPYYYEGYNTNYYGAWSNAVAAKVSK